MRIVHLHKVLITVKKFDQYKMYRVTESKFSLCPLQRRRDQHR